MYWIRLWVSLPIKKNRTGKWTNAPLTICTDFPTSDREEDWMEQAEQIILERLADIFQSLIEIRQKRGVSDTQVPDHIWAGLSVPGFYDKPKKWKFEIPEEYIGYCFTE